MSFCVLKATEMDKYVCFLLLVSILSTGSSETAPEGYRWQDYTGVIPENALPAGHGENDTLIYIGQVPDEDMVIPGKIYENDENIYYEFGEQAWVANESIKILCTDNAENFEWIPTTIYGIQNLRRNTTLIKGGYQEDFLTFIGRVQQDGRTEVGKVICRETNCLALYTNEDGEEKEYQEFEILSYNPDNENIIDETRIKE